MKYCSKCGRKLELNAKFCTGCGERVENPVSQSVVTTKGGASATQGAPGQSAANRQDENRRGAATHPNNVPFPHIVEGQPQIHEPQNADPNAVQYVFVNKKTGKITNKPGVVTGSEGCFSFFGVALAAVAFVIIMVVGAVIVSGAFSKKSGGSEDYEMWESISEPEVSSVSEVSSYADFDESSEEEVPVSSEEVSSSEPEIPDELLAKNLQKKIKGKWRTEVPYKSMNLPGIFEFDGKGKCKCTVKALFFSKKFEGEYNIKDGGECVISLDGLDEYSENDMMTGQIRLIDDNKIEFTVGDTVWRLNREE